MQPPNPNPNYPPQNQSDPNALYYQQLNYSYYYPNHQPPNPNYPHQTFQSDSLISNHDPYYNVPPTNQIVNPPDFDPNSQSYGYEYQTQQPGGVVYQQYQAVSVEARTVPYYSDPNGGSISNNWGVNEATAPANIVNPPDFDPNSQSYGYEYQTQQPGGVVYQQYQAVSVEARTVPYYSDPNGGSISNNWGVNEATAPANAVTLPPNGMHQYVPAKPKPVSMFNRRAKLKGFVKKEPKTKVVQSAWCEVCRVSCDTKDVLDKHKSGKKHMKNLEKLGVGSAPSSLPVPVASAGPSYPVIGPLENPNKKKPTQSAAKVVQSACCEVCKVKCDTIEVLNVHNLGKKHKKNMEKLTKASVPVPDPVTFVTSESSAVGLPVNPGKSVCVGMRKSKKKAAGSLEDLETKRRKILEGGAPVSTVRTCVTCNVVCNSETVFQHHIQGQKHMAMILKLASQRVNIAAGAM